MSQGDSMFEELARIALLQQQLHRPRRRMMTLDEQMEQYWGLDAEASEAVGEMMADKDV